MRKTIKLRKIAYYSQRKINAVEITIKIEYKDSAISYIDFEKLINVPVILICGAIWDGRHYDIVRGGQCIDEIYKYVRTPKVKRIMQIWEQYHLNDMKSGSKKQTDALELWRKENNITGWDYAAACEYLKSIDLYMDKGYKYGTAWLYMPVPVEIINELNLLS
jgi:hypothetical protein